jgi:hypothetical protein
MTRVVPGARRRSLPSRSILGVLGAVLASVGLAGCPGEIDPSLVPSQVTGPCDAMPIFAMHSCASTGICHDNQGSAAGFDMATAGWETHLVGVNPPNGGTIAGKCGGMGPYLDPGSSPATGLFIKKLTGSPGCGDRMPQLATLKYLTTDEMSCVQRWANQLVMNAGGGGGNTDGGAGQ